MKLTKEIIKEISNIKNELDWMYDFRIKAFEYFEKAKNPSWGPKIDVDFDSITYYKKRTEELTNDWEKISCAIRNEFKDLGVIDAEKKYLDGIECVIVGGESDIYARPLNYDWVLHIREQCVNQNVSSSSVNAVRILLKTQRCTNCRQRI